VWKHRKTRHDNSDPNFDYEAWKRKHTAFADDAVPLWVDAVTKRFKNSETERFKDTETKFVCVGYCFGAPYVCNELAKDNVVAGAFAHPAFLKEHHFESIKSMCARTDPHLISLTELEPLFLSCSEVDHTFDVESRRRALHILQAGKKRYHYQLFSGVEHGFALRGNQDDPYERE
jgi:dienelactone hydrolase